MAWCLCGTKPLSNPLQRRHNEHDSVSNHQCLYCLFSCLFRHRSKKISKLRVTGLCVGNSPGTGEFPTQKASNAENVSIWWSHHASDIWGHWCQKQVSQAEMNNCIPKNIVGCNYLSLLEIPASGAKVLISLLCYPYPTISITIISLGRYRF